MKLDQKSSTTGLLVVVGLFVVGAVTLGPTDIFGNRHNMPLPDQLAKYWWDSEKSCDEAFRLEHDTHTATMSVKYVDGYRDEYLNTVIEVEEWEYYRFSGQDADGGNIYAKFDKYGSGLALRIIASFWAEGEDRDEHANRIFNCGRVG